MRKVRQFFRIDDAVDYRALIDRRASPDERALLSEVYQVLERLPIDHRLAWTERHLEGEALDQVALLCGCSLATAKRRIAAAQAALDKEIGRE
jgi:RNA polymerase sigma-70 factor (ECF subfamily)